MRVTAHHKDLLPSGISCRVLNYDSVPISATMMKTPCKNVSLVTLMMKTKSLDAIASSRCVDDTRLMTFSIILILTHDTNVSLLALYAEPIYLILKSIYLT